MATKNLRIKDARNLLATPEAERKKADRKGSSRRRRSSFTDQNKNKVDETENLTLLGTPVEDIKRPISREERAQIKFGHPIYSKAASLFESLKGTTGERLKLDFENEFEKRRAYSLAFAAKRYESILKDVLLDSSFYSSYFKLETFHHSKVMVMLIDFYEHSFRFSESTRKKIEVDSRSHMDHIHDIQNAFFKHKTKLCSAFARNRIKACALTLDAMLPEDVKREKEHGSQHPLFAWVNPFVSDSEQVVEKLKEDGFEFRESLDLDEEASVFTHNTDSADLLKFPPSVKDDVYNSELALNSSLLPMSKPRYLTAELCKRIHTELSQSQQKSRDILFPTVTIEGENETANKNTVEGFDIILTHPDTGCLAVFLCSLLCPKKRLFVFGCHGDKSSEVDKNLKRIGASNFILLGEEFKNVLPTGDERFSSVKLIVCNPPCSKSGVVNLVDFIIQEGVDTGANLSKEATPARIRGYAEEQATTVRVAFGYPSVQSVVYSTFSTRVEENENLVNRVVQSQQNAKNQFEPINVVEGVNGDNSKVENFMKVKPSFEMDGFFVALLKRKIKDDSVHEVMERANKKGLLKKSRATSGKADKKKTVQPPHVARRLSIDKDKSPKTSPKSPRNKIRQNSINKKNDADNEEDGRFKF